MEFNDFIREEQKEVEVNTTTWLNSVEVLKNAREEQHGNEAPNSPHAQFQHKSAIARPLSPEYQEKIGD